MPEADAHWRQTPRHGGGASIFTRNSEFGWKLEDLPAAGNRRKLCPFHWRNRYDISSGRLTVVSAIA
jgi:hypothetical protein